MPGGSLVRKSSSGDCIPNWRKNLEACKAKNQFQVCYQCSPLVRSASAS